MSTSDKLPSDMWFTAQGGTAETPVMYRGRESRSIPKNREEFPHLIVVDICYTPIDSLGLPSSEQYAAIARFEEQCIDPLEERHIGLLSFVRTFNGVVRYFLYVRNVEEVADTLARNETGDFSLSLATKLDPEWSEYQRFLVGTKGGNHEKEGAGSTIEAE